MRFHSPVISKSYKYCLNIFLNFQIIQRLFPNNFAAMNENDLIILLLVMASATEIVKVGAVFRQKFSMNYNY